MSSILQRIYVSNHDFWHVTEQSCDCSSIVIDFGNRLELYEHTEYGEDGCITTKTIESFDPSVFSLEVDLENESFMFDKNLSNDDGTLNAVRFKSKDVFLFIFASEYNLILTKSKWDIFEDKRTPLPEKEAVLLFK